MRVSWIEPSILGSIVVIFALGLLVNIQDFAFAEESQIESELKTLQNSIDALSEKSYHLKYLGNDLFQLKQIGTTIDNKISQVNDPKIKAKLFNLSDKYNRAALSFLEKISNEQKASDASPTSKQLVEKTKNFVINIDILTNKKLEDNVKEDFIKSEIKRIKTEDRFKVIHQEVAIEDLKFGDMRDPLIDTIVRVADAEEYDLLDIGLQKLIKKTEHYQDEKIQKSIDDTLKLIYEIQLKKYQSQEYKDELKLSLKTLVDESVTEVVTFVDDAKKQVESDKAKATKSNDNKGNKNKGKSEGKGKGKNK